MLKLVLPGIKKIEFLTQKDPNAISFAQGALRIGGVHETIRMHAQEILKTDKADYYANVLGIAALREKLATILSATHGLKLTIDNLMISHGSVGGIVAFCLTMLGEGDEVVLPQPTYPVYQNVVKIAKATPVMVDVYVEVNNGNGPAWEFDLDRIKAATTERTKLIMFSNPSNPLGFCISKIDLENLIAWCVSKNIYLLMDEVYDDYIFEATFNSIMPYLQQSPLLIRAGSFSKNFGMSGWRVGYLAADATVIAHFMGTQDAILCCPNVLAQYAALYALDHKNLVSTYVEKVKQSRKIALTNLQPLVDEGFISFIRPSANFYLFIKTNEIETTPLVYALLAEAKVGLVPGGDFGTNSGSYMRLCYARDPELVRIGTDRMVDFFRSTGMHKVGTKSTNPIMKNI